jgi:molybdopterin biosynthesis enzyme MoaB
MSTITQNMNAQDRAKVVQFALQNDPMRMGEGAFVGLCTQNNVKIIRGGTGFAVKAVTASSLVNSFLQNLTYGEVISNSDTRLCDQFYSHAQAVISNQGSKDIVLYLPDPVAAHFAMGANKSVGLGGAEHELGHILCDRANKMPQRGFFEKVLPTIRKFVNSFDFNANPSLRYESFRDYTSSASEFANLFADIRLENMMSVMYPPTKQRFVDIQKCIFALEDPALHEATSLNILIVMMRDLGKNHKSPELDARIKFYKKVFPTEFKLVNNKLIHLVKMNQVQSEDIDGTLHFPIVATWEFITEMKELAKKPPKLEEGDDEGDDEGEEEGDGKGKDGKGEKDDKEKGDKGKGDAEGESEEGEDGDGKGEQEGDDDKDGKDDDGKDGKGEKEDKDGKDKDDQASSDESKENKPTDTPKAEEKVKKNATHSSGADMIKSIQNDFDRGNFDADTLDKLQEKAEEEIKKLDQASGSSTYIPNGHKVIYHDRNRMKSHGLGH